MKDILKQEWETYCERGNNEYLEIRTKPIVNEFDNEEYEAVTGTYDSCNKSSFYNQISRHNVLTHNFCKDIPDEVMSKFKTLDNYLESQLNFYLLKDTDTKKERREKLLKRKLIIEFKLELTGK